MLQMHYLCDIGRGNKSATNPYMKMYRCKMLIHTGATNQKNKRTDRRSTRHRRQSTCVHRYWRHELTTGRDVTACPRVNARILNNLLMFCVSNRCLNQCCHADMTFFQLLHDEMFCHIIKLISNDCSYSLSTYIDRTM